MKLRAGEPFPDFVLPAMGGANRLFYEQYCGKPALLIISASPKRFEALERMESANLTILLFGKSRLGSIGGPVINLPERLREKLDANTSKATKAVLLNSRLRIEQIFDTPSPELLEEVAMQVAPLREVRRIVTGAAPVLFADSIIEPALSRALIELHQSENIESRMNRGIGSEQELKVDPRIKSRWDHPLIDQGLIQQLTAEIARGLIPAITRSFHFKPTRFEGYKVVAYKSTDNGCFGLHRDNVAEEVRHRRLALSINLNTDFEGGELYFPEYSTDLYRPEAGSALVFSGSLLHGVKPVTSGVRYALITFLW